MALCSTLCMMMVMVMVFSIDVDAVCVRFYDANYGLNGFTVGTLPMLKFL